MSACPYTDRLRVEFEATGYRVDRIQGGFELFRPDGSSAGTFTAPLSAMAVAVHEHAKAVKP